MKYLSVLFGVFSVVMIILGIRTRVENHRLGANKTELQGQINSIQKQINMVQPLQSTVPVRLETLYNSLIRSMVEENNALAADVDIRVTKIKDFQTIQNYISPSEIPGVKKLAVTLASKKHPVVTCHIFEEAQKQFPVLIEQLVYSYPTNINIVLNLYGI